MEDVECVQVLKDGGELCFLEGKDTTTMRGFYIFGTLEGHSHTLSSLVLSPTQRVVACRGRTTDATAPQHCLNLDFESHMDPAVQLMRLHLGRW